MHAGERLGERAERAGLGLLAPPTAPRCLAAPPASREGGEELQSSELAQQGLRQGWERFLQHRVGAGASRPPPAAWRGAEGWKQALGGGQHPGRRGTHLQDVGDGGLSPQDEPGVGLDVGVLGRFQVRGVLPVRHPGDPQRGALSRGGRRCPSPPKTASGQRRRPLGGDRLCPELADTESKASAPSRSGCRAASGAAAGPSRTPRGGEVR